MITIQVALLAAVSALGQTNYDESKVPAYTLPNPLVMQDGRAVTEAAQWPARRAEILTLFETHMFGKMPAAPKNLRFEVRSVDENALGGLAIQKQIRIFLSDKPEPRMDLLLYLPKSEKPVPVFLALNFIGNQSIQPDSGIFLCESHVLRRSGTGIVDHHVTDESRGTSQSRWPVEMIVRRGYGLATICCGDIDPDFHDGYKNGVHPLFPGGFHEDGTREGDAPSTITAWTWGLSRALDYLTKEEPAVDRSRVAVMGHSRLGKTALWAGATDERFALVISNNSGCGGAALSRREFGETVRIINTNFPHWFCDNFKKYNDDVASLPIDQHQLVALSAPRPIYIASAEGDRWADPHGEFLSAKGADPVYRLLCGHGLPAKAMPEVEKPTVGRIGYHIRSGKHNVTEYDWQQYLDFADKHLQKK